MSEMENNGPAAFFQAQRKAFDKALQGWRHDERLIQVLVSQAIDNYERNAAIQAAGQPAHECAKGCETCCCLRVVATAPEIFLAGQFIRVTAGAYAKVEIDLAQRLADAQAATDGQSEQTRMQSRHLCPFIIEGACAIYVARPLACRGHISFDRDACIGAAKGEDIEVPTSAAHRTVRSLVQNAMQASMRDAGLGWGVYEFLAALNRSLQDETCEARWRAGEDVFSDLRLGDIDLEDMAATFDELSHAAEPARQDA
jgi:Fe-S-cluster containining protein